jgi:hypothetical protein
MVPGMTENPNQTANHFDAKDGAEMSMNIRLGSVGRSAAGTQTRLHLQVGNVVFFRAVLRIHDILVWIRIWIRGSMPLTNGSG